MNFQNKVIWITGASSGIGEALAYAFAAQKAKLILSARRVDELERVKKNCNLPDSDILILPMDVSEYELMAQYTQKAITHFGQIDVLINNAGLGHWSKVSDTGLGVIKKIMDTNFMGGVALTKAVLPEMLARKQGQIVVISSVMGKIYTPKQSAYAASKQALHGFYNALRAEVFREGINVLLVCPGFVKTNIAKSSLNKDGVASNRESTNITNGLPPKFVAGKILDAISSDKQEIIIAGTKEKLAVMLNRFAPGLFAKFIGRNKLM